MAKFVINISDWQPNLQLMQRVPSGGQICMQYSESAVPMAMFGIHLSSRKEVQRERGWNKSHKVQLEILRSRSTKLLVNKDASQTERTKRQAG